MLPANGVTVTHSWTISGQGSIIGAANGPSVTVTAGAGGSFTLTDNVTREGCASSCNKTVTVVPTPTVSTRYNPPSCSQKTFTVDVLSPVSGVVYSIDQPGNNLTFPTQTSTAGSAVQFTGLTNGDGYTVTITTNVAGCTGTSSCATNSDVPPPVSGREAVSSVSEVKVTEPVSEAIKGVATAAGSVESIDIRLESLTKVTAAPNPYTDRVKFNLVSAVSGMGSLEIYNTLGQKIATVYQGFVTAGINISKEYVVPAEKRSTLIYIFKVGEQRVSGKLLGLK